MRGPAQRVPTRLWPAAPRCTRCGRDETQTGLSVVAAQALSLYRVTMDLPVCWRAGCVCSIRFLLSGLCGAVHALPGPFSSMLRARRTALCGSGRQCLARRKASQTDAAAKLQVAKKKLMEPADFKSGETGGGLVRCGLLPGKTATQNLDMQASDMQAGAACHGYQAALCLLACLVCMHA